MRAALVRAALVCRQPAAGPTAAPARWRPSQGNGCGPAAFYLMRAAILVRLQPGRRRCWGQSGWAQTVGRLRSQRGRDSTEICCKNNIRAVQTTERECSAYRANWWASVMSRCQGCCWYRATTRAYCGELA